MKVEEWLGEDNKLGIDIWEKKYRNNGETFDEWLDRVSNGNEELKEIIKEKKFLFGGRILANRGLQDQGKKISYSNCYLIKNPTDSIESIFDCAKDMARTYSYGGGCGIDLGKLAPRGAKINNAAKETTGSVSFMDLYSLVTGLICQEGRRGALMISLPCNHPDLEEFIEIKSGLDKITKANISIRITDEFMYAVKNNEPYKLSFTREETGETIEKTVNARDVFKKICEINWDYAEPGMLFWDRIENWNLLSENKEFKYGGVNPCFGGKMKLLTTDGYRTFEELNGTESYIYNAVGNIVKGKVWCSGEKETVKVTIGVDYKEIICTPDHKFMTTDGNECMAKDLKGKYIMPYNSHDILYVTSVVPNGIEKVYDFSEPTIHWGIVEGCVVHNCAEEPLPEGGSCLLGSINLSEFVKHYSDLSKTVYYFDYDDFERVVRIATRALNDVLIEGMPLHPLEYQRESVNNWRQIGLGIMGLADMLIKMGIRYGSKESIDLCDAIGHKMAFSALYESNRIAKLSGACYPMFNSKAVSQSPYFNKHLSEKENSKLRQDILTYGLANSQLLTIPPCGSIATMLGISGGIEPIYANYYTRKTESLYGHDEYYKVYTPIVKQYMGEYGLTDDSQLPDFFVTAQNLNYKERIDMQAVWQTHIDASISSTVNVLNSFTVEETEDLYMYAWEKGLKGVTIYRDGCRRGGILTTDSPKEKKNEDPKSGEPARREIVESKPGELARGEIIKVNNHCIGLKRTLITGCGTLHCTAFFDPDTGKLLETYFSKGSDGGCSLFMTGLSRMISLAARGGVSIYDIVDQLKSSGTCPSYAVRRATKHDTSKGSSCPVAIGNALIDMYNEILDKISPVSKTEPRSNIVSKKAVVEKNSAKCPECGGNLVFEGGCNTCKDCGWSRCD